MKTNILDKQYIKPTKIFANIYFVGVYEASTHIIDTGDGLILIDPGYLRNLPLVLNNINEVGLDVRDIRYVLLSHGHYDHVEATKELCKLCKNVKTFIGKDDLDLAREYFEPDFLLEDADEISLGNTTIRCVATPGHTDGTMSFFFDCVVDNQTYSVGMHGGAGTNTLIKGYAEDAVLAENREKFLRSLEILQDYKVDVFLGNHVWNNQTDIKIRFMEAHPNANNPFLNNLEWEQFLGERKQKINLIIEKERNMQKVINEIEEQKIVAIIRGVEDEDLIPLVNAMYDGGIRLVEVTYGKKSDEETAASIQKLVKTFGDKMIIGAGTVLTTKQVELTCNVGGKFIISPDANPDVIQKTKACNLVSIPGVLTPTEITTAIRNGADFVKLFPITSLGPEYVKAIKAPLSDVKMLAVGGVDETNMKDYLKVGVSGFGIGSNIVDKKLIANKDFEAITELSKKFVEVLK